MLQGEHSAILLTFIMLPFVIKIFVLSILSGCFTVMVIDEGICSVVEFLTEDPEDAGWFV